MPAQNLMFSSWEEYLSVFHKLCQTYHFPVDTLGVTYLGREIPMARLGNGKHKILYIGTVHASEWFTGALLLKFMEEYGKAMERSASISNINLSFLFHTRTIYVVPVLNGDGMELVLRNGDSRNPLMDRVLAANHGSRDFRQWKANGRGVDINRNFSAGFGKCFAEITDDMLHHGAPKDYCGDHPESEPETLSVCNFIRRTGPFDLLLAFHTAGEEIFDTYENYADARVSNIARILANLSGYSLSCPPKSALHGGLKDWYLQEYRAPAMTIECGKGETPIPLEKLGAVYEKLTPMLFCGAVLS